MTPPGGGVLGLIFARYVPLAPTPLQSIRWPIIDPVLVTFGQICNFRDPNLVTFYLCIYLSSPILKIERRTLYFSPTSSPGRFSRPTSKAKEKRPGDEVGICTSDRSPFTNLGRDFRRLFSDNKALRGEVPVGASPLGREFHAVITTVHHLTETKIGDFHLPTEGTRANHENVSCEPK